MLDSLRPYLSRIISALITSGLGYLATRFGMKLESTDAVALAGSVGTFVTLVVFSVLHKLIDKKVNPADAASAHIAVDSKVRAATLKRSADLNRS